MSLIAQQVANLLNGVSQRPQEQRHSSQAEAQVNGLSSRVRGLMKRPPLVYLGKLTAVTTGWATAFVHSINRDVNERYHVVLANGLVSVFDAILATPVSVISPQGTAYLTDAAGAGFRAATAGDTTMIVNRGVTVKQGTTKAAAPKFEALIFVRQADYSTIYQVTLNGVPVGITTIPASTSAARVAIGTDKIATDLVTAFTAEPLMSPFTFTRYGSTIYVVRTDGKDFTLSTFDGLSDKGLQAVKGHVQVFTDLPRRAVNGFVAEVTGDPSSALDNYWVKYDDQGNPQQDGVWRECPKPGTAVDLDSLTLPHRLVRNGDILGPVEHSVVDPGAQVTETADPATPATVNTSWLFTEPGAVAIPANTPTVFTDHNTGVKRTLVAGDAGVRFTASYYVDGTASDDDFSVVLIQNGTTIGTKTYRRGTAGSGVETLSVITPLVNGDVMKLVIQYNAGVTPTNKAKITTYEFTFYFLGTPVHLHSINIYTGFAYLVKYTTSSLPGGMIVTNTVDAVVFNYTVTGASQTNVAVASALAALINAHATYITVDNIDGSFVVYRTDNANLAVVPSSTFPSATVFNNSSLSMVVNEHAGRRIKNHGDGSIGAIASNTAKTITVTSLTGGATNTFSPGDSCSVIGAAGVRYFVFQPCPWNARGVGDLTVVPFPSFLDNTISEVVFYQNRLGFLSNENIVFSSAGDLFNFFRYSAAQLLADDVIDVRAAHAEVSLFHSAVLWNEGLYLFSSNAQWQVSGEPVLTPTTIRIDKVSSYPNTPGPRPAPAGTRMYSTRGKNGYTQVQQFYLSGNAINTVTIVDATDVSQDVPKFIAGSPLVAVADETLGFFAVLAGGDQKNLYIYSYGFDEADRTRTQSSWSKWSVSSGTIVGLDLLDGKLGVLTVESDGAYLYTIDLNVALDTVSNDEKAKYLDRQVSNTTVGVSAAYNGGTGTTTWTLPFNVATNGSEGVLQVVKRGATISLLTSTRPAVNQIAVAGQGDLTAASVYIGIQYQFRYKPSRFYFRNRNEEPETRGWLTLRYLDVFYHDTTDFDAVVTLDGRAAKTYTTSLLLPASGKVRIPVQGRNEYTSIELVNSTPGACAFSALDWEGSYSTRSKRV